MSDETGLSPYERAELAMRRCEEAKELASDPRLNDAERARLIISQKEWREIAMGWAAVAGAQGSEYHGSAMVVIATTLQQIARDLAAAGHDGPARVDTGHLRDSAA